MEVGGFTKFSKLPVNTLFNKQLLPAASYLLSTKTAVINQHNLQNPLVNKASNLSVISSFRHCDRVKGSMAELYGDRRVAEK
jgi:hypothetical protein